MATFPRIILEGAKEVASTYVRRGLAELFRTEALMTSMGVPVLRRTVAINDVDKIFISIAENIQIVRIYAAPEHLVTEDKKEKEYKFDYSECPPAFVLYMRKDKYGTPDKDYLVVYDQNSESWKIATLEGLEYEGAANTGYWELEDGNPCDVITWHGQSGGFSNFHSARKSYFFRAGAKIQGPANKQIIAAYYDNDEEFYYALVDDNNFNMYIYRLESSGWTQKHHYDWYDYADIPSGGFYDPNELGWKFTGNPYVSKNGDVIGCVLTGLQYTALDPGNIWVGCNDSGFGFYYNLVKINLRTGVFSVIADNLDSVPKATFNDSGALTRDPPITSASYTVYEGVHDGSVSTDYDSPSDIVPSPSLDFVRSVNIGNLGSPKIVRSFSGQKGIYTYEVDINYTYSVSILSSSSLNTEGPTAYSWYNWHFPSLCIASGPDLQYVVTQYSLFGSEDTSHKYTENINTLSTLYCYYRGEDGASKTLVTSIVLSEYTSKVACSNWFRSNFGDRASSNDLGTDDQMFFGNAGLGFGVYGNAGDVYSMSLTTDAWEHPHDSQWYRMSRPYNFDIGSTAAPNGTAVCAAQRRIILDHHPEVADSWSYMEESWGWDLSDWDLYPDGNPYIPSSDLKKTLRCYDMGDEVGTVVCKGDDPIFYTDNASGAGKIRGMVDFRNADHSTSWLKNRVSDGCSTTISTTYGQTPAFRCSWWRPFIACFLEYDGVWNGVDTWFKPAGWNSTASGRQLSFMADFDYYDWFLESGKTDSFNPGFSISTIENTNMLGNYTYRYPHLMMVSGGGVSATCFDFDYIPEVAVHRTMQDGTTPYIWLKKRIFENPSADINEALSYIPGQFSTTPSSLSSTSAFGVLASWAFSTPERWETMGANDYCYIQSNVLTKELIEELTEETSGAILGIGII